MCVVSYNFLVRSVGESSILRVISTYGTTVKISLFIKFLF